MLLGRHQHDDLLVRGNQLTTGLRNNDRADVITDTDLMQFCRPRNAGHAFRTKANHEAGGCVGHGGSVGWQQEPTMYADLQHAVSAAWLTSSEAANLLGIRR